MKRVIATLALVAVLLGSGIAASPASAVGAERTTVALGNGRSGEIGGPPCFTDRRTPSNFTYCVFGTVTTKIVSNNNGLYLMQAKYEGTTAVFDRFGVLVPGSETAFATTTMSKTRDGVATILRAKGFTTQFRTSGECTMTSKFLVVKGETKISEFDFGC